MLAHLSIQNYALIGKIEIDFPAGLSIITGETGAGKSILLGALSLIAGTRADSTSLMDKDKKCIVEGVYDIRKYSLNEFFADNDLDNADHTVIRREVSPDGKSRAFINDTPVTLSVLRELSLRLIDIHSQHETLMLNEVAYQLSVTDSFAQIIDDVTRYKVSFRKFKETEKKLFDLLEKEKQSKLDEDYWRFQFEELDQLNLKSGEQEKAEEDLKVLENAEDIKAVLEKIAVAMNGGEINVLSALGESRTQLSSISKLNSAYQELLSRINSSFIELKDVAGEIESLAEKISFDPNRVEELTARLDSIYRLQKKHQVNSVESLMEVKNKMEERLSLIFSLEKEISSLQQEIEKMRQKLFAQAKKISSDRKKCLPKLEKEIRSLLTSLAMPNAQFKVESFLLETLTSDGIDRMRFLFSANKGGELKEISKAASGGELSRLMLSVKSLIAKNTFLPTIIFDEIDSGVSGSTAELIGKMILKMSESMQVIVITHLPQIASKGDCHFTVYKEEAGGKNFTQIKLLSNDERVKEIAKMLSAGKITDASLKNAKELLSA
ncbi:MAG TPA: DNA repair protein RecN [Bacteroidia bacterium]